MVICIQEEFEKSWKERLRTVECRDPLLILAGGEGGSARDAAAVLYRMSTLDDSCARPQDPHLIHQFLDKERLGVFRTFSYPYRNPGSAVSEDFLRLLASKKWHTLLLHLVLPKPTRLAEVDRILSGYSGKTENLIFTLDLDPDRVQEIRLFAFCLGDEGDEPDGGRISRAGGS